jgi:hypothetical protein
VLPHADARVGDAEIDPDRRTLALGHRRRKRSNRRRESKLVEELEELGNSQGIWVVGFSSATGLGSKEAGARRFRLSTLVILYIHPLKVIFRPSHHKIYNFPASIHPLYHPLSTVGPTCHFI